jgi:sterol desaturase/sphingolipid hydroxylase (fatty acid hydroxylase superfamily)
MSQTPPLEKFLKSLAVMYFLEDLIFFTSHWLLHRPFLYKHVHKIHHEYNTTVAIAGMHFHVAEFVLANIAPTKIYLTAVALLFGPLHVNTVVIWSILRTLDAYNGHCGYSFSWCPIQILPFCAHEDFHDFHHSHNCGNFSSQLRIWDIVFGTNSNFNKHKQKLKAKLA